MTTQQIETVTRSILGYEGECNCDHCGRPLKVGIQLSSYGIIGADCLNAAVIFDRKRWGAGKPGAAYLRTLAKLKQRDNAEQLSRMGYYARSFDLALNPQKLEA